MDGVCPDGHMKKTNRYRLSLACNGLDLRAFPFDTQVLPIRLKASLLLVAFLSASKMAEARNRSSLPCEKDTSEVILIGPEGGCMAKWSWRLDSGMHGENSKQGIRRMGHSVKMQADRLADFKIQPGPKESKGHGAMSR